MDSINAKYKSLRDSISRLDEDIHTYENLSEELRYNYERNFRNSLIQTFEFTIELLWRFFHTYLAEVYGEKDLPLSSIPVWRAAERNGIISKDEFEALLRATLDRNKTSHAYQEVLAVEIAGRIPEHYKVIEFVFKKVSVPDDIPD